MRKLDRLKKDIEELKPKSKFALSFDHLSDEDLEKLREEYKANPEFLFERVFFNHPEWTDEEIYQKMDDDLIAIYREWRPTEKEVREMQQHLKKEWPDRPKKIERLKE